MLPQWTRTSRRPGRVHGLAAEQRMGRKAMEDQLKDNRRSAANQQTMNRPGAKKKLPHSK